MSRVVNVLPIVQSQRKLGQSVAYYPSIAKVLGSTDATIFVCQFVFWCEEFEDENENISVWIQKTASEIYDKTGIGHNSQVTVRKKLRELGILQEKLMGNPAKLNFKFDFSKVNELLSIGIEVKNKVKNPTQTKGMNGKFVSASESFGNLASEKQASDIFGNLASETFGNKIDTFSETTYIRESNKEDKEENTPEKIEIKSASKDANIKPNTATTKPNDKAAEFVAQTNKEFRMIETHEELTDITEKVIDVYAESLKKDFERRGFVIANKRDYAIEFSNQFFKTFQMCSLQDTAIRRKLSEWAYIFAKVNTEIAQAQKAVNMSLPPQYKQPTPTTNKNANLLSMLD